LKVSSANIQRKIDHHVDFLHFHHCFDYGLSLISDVVEIVLRSVCTTVMAADSNGLVLGLNPGTTDNVRSRCARRNTHRDRVWRSTWSFNTEPGTTRGETNMFQFRRNNLRLCTPGTARGSHTDHVVARYYKV